MMNRYLVSYSFACCITLTITEFYEVRGPYKKNSRRHHIFCEPPQIFSTLKTTFTLTNLYPQRTWNLDYQIGTIYLFSFVETPRKFIIAELSIRKLGSSSVLIMLMKIRAYGSKAAQ